MTRLNDHALPVETWIFLALGGLAVAALALDASMLSAEAPLVVLVVSVSLAGLPHGALDPWIAWQSGLWRGRWGWLAFNLGYLAVAAAVVAAWWFAPGFSLALFLAISAWHFGGDWQQDLPRWARATAGSALLALPALRWPTEVSNAFAVLAGPDGAMIAERLAAAAPWLAAGMAASALLAWRRARATTLELAVVAGLALLLPPLVYFIVYFCALHSLRHLRIAARDADARSRRRMVRVALVYTVLALLAAAAAWPWLASGTAVPQAGVLKLVFIGLAALTLPHMLVVMWFEHRRVPNP